MIAENTLIRRKMKNQNTVGLFDVTSLQSCVHILEVFS